ncbi:MULTISPECIES: RNA-binding protein [Paenibacillus]|uniref:RNA-binding protein n=1 Tax=Paenibacillus TaxID=44249 RepID=UPI0022B8BE59|nr:RNA-binding protein [Paenibacillus caseinilyticus]MCZ8522738.1 RNA-binding protein [Paenibacillus caseinilyticus]
MTTITALHREDSSLYTVPAASRDLQQQHPVPSGADVLQLPDFQFVTYCFETFGLNRGIYNTIDEWLYRFGVREITQRRQTIIAFLTEQQRQGRSPGTYLKFGKGGLTKLLHEFVAK